MSRPFSNPGYRPRERSRRSAPHLRIIDGGLEVVGDGGFSIIRGTLEGDPLSIDPPRADLPPPPILVSDDDIVYDDELVEEDPTLMAEPEPPGRGSEPVTDPGGPGARGRPAPDVSRAREADEPEVWDPEPGFAARLTFLAGPGRGKVIDLPAKSPVVLGRSSRCDVPLRDLSISRRHAELRWTTDGRFEVRDLGSRNGCSVDDRPCLGWTPLDSGSVLGIGDLRLRLEVERADEDTFIRRKPALAAPLAEPPPYEAPPVAAPPRSAHHLSAAAGFEERWLPDLPPAVRLGLIFGGGILAGLLVLMLIVAAFSGGDESAETPTTTESPDRPANRFEALVLSGREHIESERWSEARKSLAEALAMEPEESEVKDLLALARREGSAQEALAAGRQARDSRKYRAAVTQLRNVPSDSTYHAQANALLEAIDEEFVAPRLAEARDLIANEHFTKAEKQELRPVLRVWPGHPDATRLLEEAEAARQSYLDEQKDDEPEPVVRTAPARKTPRKTRRTRRPRRTAAAEPAPSAEHAALLSQARKAFAEGRVASARAAAETASDVGVRGADALAKQITAFDRAYKKGESADRNVPVALAAYTDALYLAEEIAPKRGGKMGGTLRARLGHLHYLAALQDERADKRRDALHHARKALKYNPNLDKARDLVQRLGG